MAEPEKAPLEKPNDCQSEVTVQYALSQLRQILTVQDSKKSCQDRQVHLSQVCFSDT